MAKARKVRKADRSTLTRSKKTEPQQPMAKRKKRKEKALHLSVPSKKVKSDVSAESKLRCAMELEDIALIVMSLLDVDDVLSIARCSRFWYNLSCSDSLWKQLYKRRWPNRPVTFQLLIDNNMITHRRAYSRHDELFLVPEKRWRTLYINKHEQVQCFISSIVQPLETGLPLGIQQYLAILGTMESRRVGFKDVKCFLLNSSLSILTNLVGLHYAIFRLQVPQEEVMNILLQMGLSRGKITVQWFRPRFEFFGLMLLDQKGHITLYLGDVVQGMLDYDNVLGMLEMGITDKIQSIMIFPDCSSEEI